MPLCIIRKLIMNKYVSPAGTIQIIKIVQQSWYKYNTSIYNNTHRHLRKYKCFKYVKFL